MQESRIWNGPSAWTDFSAWLERSNFSSVFLLADENTALHCLPIVQERIPTLKDALLITVPAGESHKNLHCCAHVWEVLSTKGADRQSLLIAVGGGVTTDLGGFAAACFKRGIAYAAIPTSLLAMVDAAIGGKTGIDFQGLKNEIGAFYPAEAILIDPIFLKTLPIRQLHAGYAEMLKHGLIADTAYWELLAEQEIETLSTEDWLPLILRSNAIKAAIVAQDPKDQGIRQSLNFGHTIGHAIEAKSLAMQGADAVLHGEAIAAGMIIESFLSPLSLSVQEHIATVLSSRYAYLPVDEQDLKDYLAHDKKNTEKQVRYSLLAEIGKPLLQQSVAEGRLEAALQAYKNCYGKS